MVLGAGGRRKGWGGEVGAMVWDAEDLVELCGEGPRGAHGGEGDRAAEREDVEETVEAGEAEDEGEPWRRGARGEGLGGEEEVEGDEEGLAGLCGECLEVGGPAGVGLGRGGEEL